MTGTDTTSEVFLDDTAQEVDAPSGISLQEFFDDYTRNGPNPEYRAFEMRILSVGGYARTAGASVWEFINDAVEGTGGFSDGSYIFPHKLEIDEKGAPTKKLLQRRAMADYDNFAGHIRNTPGDIISASSDMIMRSANGGAADLLSEYWRSVDGNGKSMTDFMLEHPFKQARNYGTSIVVTDRPNRELASEADNHDPANRPTSYMVDTRNVVHWAFAADSGRLEAIAILYPKLVDNGDGRELEITLRIWTENESGVWIRDDENGKEIHEGPWSLVDAGINKLGIVPVVAVWNDQPLSGQLLGKSELLEVARLAQTVYNIDSETRDHERKAAMFLAIPVKQMSTETQSAPIAIGLETAMEYDGPGSPAWVSPSLEILQRLADHKKEKIAAAYQMAGLGAVAAFQGVTKTSSGFHAEVEFAQTERRIARYSAGLEAAEKQLAIIYLRYFGMDVATNPDLFAITYPRDFGIRDLDALVNRTAATLNLNLGQKFDTKNLRNLFKAMFPRESQQDIDGMVKEAIAKRDAARAQADAIARTQKLMSALSGDANITQEDPKVRATNRPALFSGDVLSQ